MKDRILLLPVLFLAVFAAAQTVAENAKPVTTAPANSAAAPDPLLDARTLMNKRQYAEAAAAFQAILAKSPNSAEAHAGLVRSLLHEYKLDEAEEAAKKALEAAPSAAIVHAASGDVAFRAGRFADSEAEYRGALKLDPNSARGQFGMARMLQMVSMNKRAKDTFAKAHQLDPDDQQIFEYWLETLPYTEQLEQVKKKAGEHPSEREKAHLDFLSAVAKKKPWVLTSEIKPTEIKMLPYGHSLVGVDTGSHVGAATVRKGFALNVKFNDRVSEDILLDTGAGGLLLGRKLAEKIGVVKIADTFFGGLGDQGPVRGYIGWIDKIKIGSVEFKDCLVEVSSKSDVVDESGLMGADIFDKFLVTLDFKEWKFLLNPLPNNPNAASQDDEWQDRYIAPEMQAYTKIWRFGHLLLLPVVVSDKAMGNFALDTGADSNLISPRLARQVTKLNYDGSRMRGISGDVKEVLNGDKAILQFAKMRVQSADIPVVGVGGTGGPGGTELAGLIGIRTLVQMKMTIDYRDGLVNLAVYDFKPARE
jgi:Tfp pilus assembly protein PilF/predicted aspartyl protease